MIHLMEEEDSVLILWEGEEDSMGEDKSVAKWKQDSPELVVEARRSTALWAERR